MSAPTGRNVTLLLAETKFRPRFELGSWSPHVWMWELYYKGSWVLKNWCFWTVVLEEILESPLDCKESQSVHPKGDQSWIFIGRTDAEGETPILWPPDEKNWLTGKEWKQEEKEMTEDEIVGWQQWLNGYEFGETSGIGDAQVGLACCSPWGQKELDMQIVGATEQSWMIFSSQFSSVTQ